MPKLSLCYCQSQNISPKKRKHENTDEVDKELISYMKARTAFRNELNAEAEFHHSLVPEVSITNAQQKRIFRIEVLKLIDDCLKPLLRPGDQSRPPPHTELSQSSVSSDRSVLPQTQGSDSSNQTPLNSLWSAKY